MKKINKYILLLVSVLVFSGCDDFFDPNYTNDLTEEQAFDYLSDPEFVLGLYVPAYNALPGNYTTFGGDFLDCATDNAVSNNQESNSWKLLTKEGYYTSSNFPIYTYSANYKYIKDVYQFLRVGLNDDVVYKTSSDLRNNQLKQRMKGEAYFLLAYNYFELLRDYGGIGEKSGELLGIPLIKGEIEQKETSNYKRASYAECVSYIDSLIEVAKVSGLKDEYSDASITGDELTSVYGDAVRGLPTITACNALKSRLYLYAGSKAFMGDIDAEKAKTYNEESAKAAKEIIDTVGELPDIYNLASIDDDFYSAVDGKELIMRKATQTTAWEKTNYPPVLGLEVTGRTNPSQNLVDAFGDDKGYPITDSNSDYDETSPYENRDPRFKMFIIHNDETFHGTTIEMWRDSEDPTIVGNCMVGAPNIPDESRVSLTGYYLRKFMTEKPTFVSGVTSEKPWHFCASFRLVEAYLNYAEAMNKVYGPDGKGTYGMSAREALAKVRSRAGIPTPDTYLNSCNDAEFTNLVKNERRIELCFEGHRYYDVRRWGDPMITEVKKVDIKRVKATSLFGTDSYSFNYENVYPNQVNLDTYNDGCMRYGAIPKKEIRLNPNLEQNKGWK